jgi:cell division protein FtsZ
MSDMLKFDLPKNQSSIIKVIGVGGGGSNAVTHMYKQGIKGVDFILCNTDSQALSSSPIPTKVQFGSRGLGAGSIPSVGKEAALENIDQIKELLETNTKMLFITAGMGGGTGTGGAPVLASVARELGILTVGIVTIPFAFEGRKRRMQAEAGIEELRKYVDTLLIISNDRLREQYGNLKLSEAFSKADDILTTAAKGIAEIITVTGYINVDFEDVKTVMKDSGVAIMGSGIAEGENRAHQAVEMALTSPLLNDNNIEGASNILLYIASGDEEISMDEVTEITDYIQEKAGSTAEIIWGNGTDEALGNMISVTLIATGFITKRHGNDGANIIGTLYDTPKNQPIQPEKVEEETDFTVFTKTADGQVSERRPIIEIVQPMAPQSSQIAASLNPTLFNLDSSIEHQKAALSNPPIPEPSVPANNQAIPHYPERIEPQIKHPLNEPFIDLEGSLRDRAADRVSRLKSFSVNGTNASIEELENQPAYLRKNVELKETPAADAFNISRSTLTPDENNNIEIRTNNPYLHDKAD